MFWNEEFNRVDRLFEWACTMVRVTGIEDSGWDSYAESIALLEDFTALNALDLPSDRFPNTTNTHVRLALISYSHMVEMHVPYELLANLLRLRLGKNYSIHPLAHLNQLGGSKKSGKRKLLRASPSKKIAAIKEMADKAGVPEVGEVLEGIYNSTIRNAVYHSDYALHNDTLRLLSDTYLNRDGTTTRLITFDELGKVTSEAFAFHSALFILWKRQRKLFTDFRSKILPYDHHYKGVIEFRSRATR